MRALATCLAVPEGVLWVEEDQLHGILDAQIGEGLVERVGKDVPAARRVHGKAGREQQHSGQLTLVNSL